MGVEERACGNWRGQFKSKLNFKGCLRKTHVEFPFVLVFDLGISKRGVTKFCRISEDKVKNIKGFFKKVYPQAPTPSPCLDFYLE